MTATLAGEIIDRTGPGGAPGAEEFSRFPGVSGGAYGAAVIRAALADAAERGKRRPARIDNARWFGAAKPSAPDFRDLLALLPAILVCGDYLSSGFIGLGFRDNLAPAKPVRLGLADRRPRRAARAELGAPLQLNHRSSPINRRLCGGSRARACAARFGYAGTGRGLDAAAAAQRHVGDNRAAHRRDRSGLDQTPGGEPRQSGREAAVLCPRPLTCSRMSPPLRAGAPAAPPNAAISATRCSPVHGGAAERALSGHFAGGSVRDDADLAMATASSMAAISKTPA